VVVGVDVDVGFGGDGVPGGEYEDAGGEFDGLGYGFVGDGAEVGGYFGVFVAWFVVACSVERAVDDDGVRVEVEYFVVDAEAFLRGVDLVSLVVGVDVDGVARCVGGAHGGGSRERSVEVVDVVVVVVSSSGRSPVPYSRWTTRPNPVRHPHLVRIPLPLPLRPPLLVEYPLTGETQPTPEIQRARLLRIRIVEHDRHAHLGAVRIDALLLARPVGAQYLWGQRRCGYVTCGRGEGVVEDDETFFFEADHYLTVVEVGYALLADEDVSVGAAEALFEVLGELFEG